MPWFRSINPYILPTHGTYMDNYTPRTPSDFRNFLYLIWEHLNLPEPTPMQYDIATWLQYGPKRSMVEAFRGEGKSWITSAFVCWTLDQRPDWNILVVSASKNRADDFSTFVLRLIHEVLILQHLAPKADQRNSKVSFDVAPAPAAHAPSVKSLGITSQISGSRANLIIPDDIEVPSNSQTQTMREKLSEQVKEFDAVVKPGGSIKFLGTPQHEQSVYNKLPERGYTLRVWPARYPDEKRRKAYGNTLTPKILAAVTQDESIVGHPTDPKRFTDLDLREREASYGKSGFALQFMLDTTLSDADRYPLKVEDLVVMALNPDRAPEHVVWAAAPELVINDLPNVAMRGDHFYRPMSLQGEWREYTGSVLSIDPSGRGKDELGYAIVKMLNGQLFVCECSGLVGGYVDTNLRKLAQLAAEYKVNHIRIESNFGDGMFGKLLTPFLRELWPCAVEDVPHYKQKELRIIDTLEPVMNQHKLVVDRKIIERDYHLTSNEHSLETASQYRLIYQLTRITRDKGSLSHDDRLDALAIAVAYWVEQMGQSVEDAKKAQEEETLQNELENFLEHVQGIGPKRASRKLNWSPARNHR